jgi:hypothetical protein
MKTIRRTPAARALRVLGALLVMAVLASLTSVAGATVRHAGSWPAHDPLVTLSIDNEPRTEAVAKLADKAGWSVVDSAPSDALVSVHVKGAPASKVLDLLLSGGDYVAERDGNLISITRATPASAPPAPVAPATSASNAPASAPSARPVLAAPSASAPAAPAPPQAPIAAKGSGSDRVVTGNSTTVRRGDVVHDLIVFGGSADVLGSVTGDLAVLGGSAHVHSGGHVFGDATAIGGSLSLDKGALVDGDVGVLGGSLHRASGALVGGHVTQKHDLAIHFGEHSSAGASRFGRIMRHVAGAVTRSALLFVFGAVLFALATRRMDLLTLEVAARPMRSFALGVVGSLVALVAIVALCITLLGIPVAIVGAIFCVFGIYAGICAVLTTVGGALLGHRSKNPYLHLALGCALYLVLSSIPYFGELVTLAVAAIGIGTLVATRAAGLIAARSKPQATAV